MLFVYLVVFLCFRLWGRTSTLFTFQTRTLEAQCLGYLHQARAGERGGGETQNVLTTSAVSTQGAAFLRTGSGAP